MSGGVDVLDDPRPVEAGAAVVAALCVGQVDRDANPAVVSRLER